MPFPYLLFFQNDHLKLILIILKEHNLNDFLILNGKNSLKKNLKLVQTVFRTICNTDCLTIVK